MQGDGRQARTSGCAIDETSGSLACQLGASEASLKWFLGGIIAYSSEVKFALLGVDRGPVITARCAEQMAAGVAGSPGPICPSLTGAGGPGSEEGKPAGTVFIAVHSPAGTHVEEHHFSQEPADVVQATLRALQMFQEVVHHLGPATVRP